MINKLTDYAEQIQQSAQNMETLVQVAIIIATFILSLLIKRIFLQRVTLRADSSEGFQRIAFRSAQRVLWPVIWLIFLWISYVVVINLNHPDQLLRIMLPLVMSFALVRLLIYMLRKGMHGGTLLRASESTIALLVWSLVGLHLLGWLPSAVALLDSAALTIGSARISLLFAIKLVILIVIGLTVANWLASLIERKLDRTEGMNASARVGLVKFIKFALVTLAILVVMSSVGIDVSSLAVFGGALGVGLGFGLQRIAANFISGFIVIMDRSIKPGDVVTIGTEFGWVQELKARYLVLRNRDGIDTLIPNENLITNDVINWSYADRNVRIRVQVDISYNNDPEKAMELVLGCAFASPRVLKTPPPTVSLLNFGDNGISIELRLWLADPELGFELVRSDIRLAIWKAFKENGIVIPYPQRDLHLKSIDKDVLDKLKNANDGN
ncbi:mechanosensitive ion channel family protein [Aliidiomarina sp. Khilg15.8]